MTMTERDEPLTPAGRLFVQPGMDQVINCAISVDDPIDVDAVKTEISNSVLVKHPRFSSIMVKDSCGRERWRKTEVNVDDHFIIRPEPLNDDPSVSDEDAVNDYLADLCVSTPLSLTKPLWEFHLLLAHKCAVLRLHHALGDGISLMSMFLSCCRRADDPTQRPTTHGIGTSSTSSNNRNVWSLLKKLSKVIWYTLVYVIEFCLRGLWLKDKRTAVSGGDGVELWPRKVATAKFNIDDMKTVKQAIANATINDVLFGIISCGLSRYLDLRSPKALKEGTQITGVAMVNLRKQSGLQDFSQLMNSKSGARWGNKFGMLLLPVYYHKGGSDPLQYVRRAKAMIDKKKLSLEGPCSYKIGDFIMSFSVKLARLVNYRIVSNTTFTISNVIGPQEDITFGGNHISSVRVTSTALSHAITMHMVSYAGKADMQILVAKDIIPDPKVLAKCFQDALLEMKEAAQEVGKN
ncbi:hypothetical protein RND71_000309 [Anisodus tanguticus]|uniref:Diacylglycerol O-acyltransferase n=1 Tax=Anisodus tanguticus TaxID=243964 RepID=A0AAE1SYI3_9SOLA|nr:hypothetical protein RND71_000309 [Anisodus tanguticus]